MIYRPYDVAGRLVLGARLASATVALSLIRTRRHGPFTPSDAMALNGIAAELVRLLAKHVALRRSAGSAAASLRSLTLIEATIAAARPRLAGREAQVSARILYGMTTAGIALDLSIGEESVATYRRRGYDRLGIASQRELLLWYLDRCPIPTAGIGATSPGRGATRLAADSRREQAPPVGRFRGPQDGHGAT